MSMRGAAPWRWALRLTAVLISACALAGALRLVVPATAGPDGEPPDARRQLAFLRAELERGAGGRAQSLFPEGYLFLHVLYGLSWVELGLRAPADERATPLREARWALAAVDSPTGRAPFSPELTPPYGVFYRGWTNWLRGGVLALQPQGRRDPGEQARFVADSIDLGAAFDASASPFLTAYPGQAWPVDSTVAMASLRLHDSLLPPRFGATVRRWLEGARQRLDPGTALLPHRVDPVTGRPTEVARATSLSISTRFLVEIDPSFAREQYLRYRDRYVITPLGLGPAVREYPAGVSGAGDVDSGPLLLGVSLSASAVTLGAAQSNGDAALAAALANHGELLGVPITTPWTKRYAAGALPIGDAFVVWSKTARPWVVATPAAPPATVSWWWRVPWLTLLTLLGTVPWLPTLRRRRSRSGPRT
jgi:hypothetical protein